MILPFKMRVSISCVTIVVVHSSLGIGMFPLEYIGLVHKLSLTWSSGRLDSHPLGQKVMKEDIVFEFWGIG